MRSLLLLLLLAGRCAAQSCARASDCGSPDACVEVSCQQLSCVHAPATDGASCNGGSCLSGRCVGPGGGAVNPPSSGCAGLECKGGAATPTPTGCYCRCSAAFAGPTCSSCAAGYSGAYPACYPRAVSVAPTAAMCRTVAQCPAGSECSVVACSGGVCVTTELPDGAVCSGGLCMAGGCSATARPCVAADCSGKGTAAGVWPACTCQCDPGFDGVSCATCARYAGEGPHWLDAGYAGVFPECVAACTVDSTCASSASPCRTAAGVCDLSVGLCREEPVPDGTACSTGACVGGRCLPDAQPGSACGDVDCNFRGTARGTRPRCSCTCSLGYGGPACDQCGTGYVGQYPDCGRCALSSSCPSGGQCRGAGRCDPASSLCVYADLPDGSPCDDSDSGTIADQCVSGTCSGSRGPYRECPSGGLRHVDRCWYMSGVGSACRGVCESKQLRFMYQSAPATDPVVPRLLAKPASSFAGARPFPWAALEAVHSGGGSFHEADRQGRGADAPADWSHGDYALACPCSPVTCSLPCTTAAECSVAGLCDISTGLCPPPTAAADGTACAGGGVCAGGGCSQRMPTAAPSAGPRAAVEGGPYTQTVYGITQSRGDLAVLGLLLSASALRPPLDDVTERLTLFAPSDAAFSALPAGVLGAMLARPELAAPHLWHSAVRGVVAPASSLVAASPLASAAGGTLQAAVTASSGVAVGGANVTAADVFGTNGVVHVVDRVSLYSPSQPDLPQSWLPEVLAAEVSTSRQSEWVRLNPELSARMRADSAATVLALSNGAVERAGLANVAAGTAGVRQLLVSHIVEGFWTAAELRAVAAAGGELEAVSGQRISLSFRAGELLLGGSARLTASDLFAVNGVVHVLDSPANAPGDDDGSDGREPLLQALAGEEALGLFSDLLQRSGVAAELAMGGERTVFAPTDAALRSLPANYARNLEMRGLLEAFVLRHVVRDREVDASDLEDAAVMTSADGARVEASTSPSGTVRINGVAVTGVDLRAVNGVAHAIAAPIDWGDFEAAATTAPTVLDVLASSSDLSTFYSAALATGLSAPLSSVDVPLTVLVPTDAAFAARPQLSAVMADAAQLERLLRFHAVLGGQSAGELLSLGAVWLPTLDAATQMPIAAAGPGLVAAGGQPPAGVTLDARPERQPPAVANGIVYRIDTVLVPDWAQVAGLPSVPAPPANLSFTPSPPGVPPPPVLCAAASVCALLQQRYQKGEHGAAFARMLWEEGMLPAFGDTSTLWTVFAPADAAWASLPTGISALVQRRAAVRRGLLRHHVVAGAALKEAELAAVSTLVSEYGASIGVERSVAAGGRVRVDGAALIGQRDSEAVNGVLHSSPVLLQPAGLLPTLGVTDAVAGVAGLQTLSAHLLSSGVGAELQVGEGPYTVFAPTDAAWAALPQSKRYILSSPAALRTVLRHHIVQQWLDTTNLTASLTLLTLEGTQLTTGLAPQSRRGTALQSWVTGSELTATNGIVHQVTSVSIPANLPAASVSPTAAVPSSAPSVVNVTAAPVAAPTAPPSPPPGVSAAPNAATVGPTAQPATASATDPPTATGQTTPPVVTAPPTPVVTCAVGYAGSGCAQCAVGYTGYPNCVPASSPAPPTPAPTPVPDFVAATPPPTQGSQLTPRPGVGPDTPPQPPQSSGAVWTDSLRTFAPQPGGSTGAAASSGSSDSTPSPWLFITVSLSGVLCLVGCVVFLLLSGERSSQQNGPLSPSPSPSRAAPLITTPGLPPRTLSEDPFTPPLRAAGRGMSVSSPPMQRPPTQV